MRPTRYLARLRRPITVTLSIGVVVVASLPFDSPAADPKVQRVVATPIPVSVFTPVGLSIPKIGLDVPVVPVGTYSDGTMGKPTNGTDVGWWLGRKAGKGNVLLDAHHDWNHAKGSFYYLYRLRPGNKVIVKGKHHRLVYRVVWVRNFDRDIDATELLGNKNGQVATLITCGGAFDPSVGTHLERIVVRAELASA